MIKNLEVSSRIYRTPNGLLHVNARLVDTPAGWVVRTDQRRRRDFGGWLLNSGSVLMACCYIDALGKVLTRGKKSGRNPNLRRFRAFVVKHMRDFVSECRRRGGRFSVRTLYSTYRNGFVHQFADRGAHWDRRGRANPYWFRTSGHPSLNVDRFVDGVVAGIKDFQAKFPTDRRNRPAPYAKFIKWLGK